MKIDTLTEPMALGTRWAIPLTRPKAEKLINAHKEFYIQLREKGLYHPETKIDVVKKKDIIKNIDVYAIQADMPDLMNVPDEKELYALDVKRDLGRVLLEMDPNCDPEYLLNHPSFECIDSIKYDKEKMYLTTLLLFESKFPVKFILEQHKKQTGEDLLGYINKIR